MQCYLLLAPKNKLSGHADRRKSIEWVEGRECIHCLNGNDKDKPNFVISYDGK